MPHRRTTLSKFIIEEQRRNPQVDTDLTGLLNDVQTACKFIASAVSRGAMQVEAETDYGAGPEKTLDAAANEIMLRECEWGGKLQGMVSAKLEQPYAIPAQFPQGRYLLLFDPLDGSPNLDVNVTVGSIFSILRASGDGAAAPADFLRPGTEQVASGFALYGPTSMVVMTLGSGVHGFTLDREIGAYTLTHPGMRIPERTREFAIDAGNERFWEPPVRQYIEECKQGLSGPRHADFTMRWTASLVADVYRILVRGGLFLHPHDTRDATRTGPLHLLYEANPMAFIIEQAGGAASTGRERLLDVRPGSIHQATPVILGPRSEVERLETYHHAYDRGEPLVFEAPLFSERGLFRASAS